MAINFDGKGNIEATTSDGVIAIKLYSLEKTIEQKDKEIERLNNIINELEEWLKFKKEQMEEFELYKRKETCDWYSTIDNIDTFIERIQELKGE